MKRNLFWIILVIDFGGIVALNIWYGMLNWDQRLGFGEYPASFWIAVLFYAVLTICVGYYFDDQLKGK